MIGIACHDGRVNNRETFRPRSSYVWFGGVVILNTLFVAERFTRGSVQAVAAGVFIAIGITVAGYLLFIRPKIDLYDEAIVITNLVHEDTVGWQDVIEIETRYSMSIVTKDRRIYAVAAPGPGRYQSRTVHRAEMMGIGMTNPDSIRAGDSPRTHSGVAAHISRLRWQSFLKAEMQTNISSQRTRQPWPASIALASFALGVLLEVIHL